MKNLIDIIFLLSLIFFSCSNNEYDKAKELYEIGDYQTACDVLSKNLEENPKEIASRELLIRCYDKNENWDKAIEQLNILNTFNPNIKYDAQLARFSALNEDFIKVRSIINKLENKLTLLFESKEEEYEKQIQELNSLAEKERNSLKRKVYENQIDSLYSKYKNIRVYLVDSLNVRDVLIAEALYYLNLNKSSAPDKIKECIKSDSSFLRYFEKPVIQKINATEKPQLYYGNVYSFHYKILEYYSQRAKLYASIGYVKEAIENFMDELYWFDNQERKSNELSIDLKYYSVLKYLNENNRYEEAVELYNRLRSTYKGKTLLCNSEIEFTRLMINRANKK